MKEVKLGHEKCRFHIQEVQSEATRKKQTVEDKWTLRSKTEEEEDEDCKDFPGLDLCLGSSHHCDHILLCPDLQMSAC